VAVAGAETSIGSDLARTGVAISILVALGALFLLLGGGSLFSRGLRLSKRR
jgi:hypothetical protein